MRCLARGRRPAELGAAEAYVRRVILHTYLDGYRRRARWPRSATCWRATTTPTTTAPPAGTGSTCAPALLTAPAPRAARLRGAPVLRRPHASPRSPAGSRISDGAVKRYLSDAIGQLEALLGPLPDAHTIDIQLVPTGVTR